jgi:hypothetical protein
MCEVRPLRALENQVILGFPALFIPPLIDHAECFAIRGNSLQFAFDYFTVLRPTDFQVVAFATMPVTVSAMG